MMEVLVNREIEIAAELLAYGPEALIAAFGAAPQVDCPVQHHFGPGVYIRECAMPAGSIVVGHYHRQDSLNILLKGRMLLLVDGRASVIEAPFMAVTPPGRKATYVLDDAIWQNVFATGETDIDRLEDVFVDKQPPIAGALA